MFTFQSLIDYDDSILDGAELVPAGIDPDLVKSEIMLQCGLLQPLYPEPETMKNAITQWFAARHWTFEHLLNIIKAEYSPIENTDRYDEQTREIKRALDRSEDESRSGTDSKSRSEDRNRSENKSHNENRDREESRDRNQDTTSDVHTEGETIGEVSAFNSDDWSNSDRNTSTGDTHGTENITASESMEGSETLRGSESLTGSDKISGTERGETSETRKNTADEDENTSEVFKQHLHGNIGVTTNQDMIEQELALLAHFNIYTWIAMNIRESLFLEVY